MKKEVFLAILLGLSLGLIITYGFYRARNSALIKQTDLLTASPSVSPSTTPNSDLIIFSPTDESIVDTADITVAGTTTAQNLMVIFVNQIEYLTSADQTGTFSQKVKLENGSNVITVISLDEDGGQVSQELIVIFTTQSLTADQTATSSTKSN